MHMKTLALFLILLALGAYYLAWLREGCELTGVMTWHGKVCLDELTLTKNHD